MREIVIGVDLDNTIVCYDHAFHRAARARALVGPEVAPRKNAVRDAVREGPGGEAAWRALQAEVYGRAIADAALHPGAARFFALCRARAIEPRIVSHKSTPAGADASIDLRRTARTWLGKHADLMPGTGRAPLISFCATRAGKLARIAALGCTHFIDDLRDLLAAPAFPAGVERLWFDPADTGTGTKDIPRFASWDAISDHLFHRS